MTRTELTDVFLASGEIPTTTLSLLGDAKKAVQSAFDSTVLEFSRDCPLRILLEETWAGVDITLAGWFEGSSVLWVEHPVDQHPRALLMASDYEVSRDGQLYLITVASGADIHVMYTRRYDVSAGGGDEEQEITLPAELHPAYFKLVASKILGRISTRHGETKRPDIAADSVNYQSKSAEYARLAKDAYTEYRRMLGLSEKREVKGAFAVSTFDSSGTRRLGVEAPWGR